MSAQAKSFDIKASDLYGLLVPVLPIAKSAPAETPGLSVVQFTVSDRSLYAGATDRFRVGVCRTPIAAPDMTFALSVRAVQSIVSFFKPTRWDDPDLTVTLTGGQLVVTQNGTFAEFAASSMAFEVIDANLPTLHNLILGFLDVEPTEPTVFAVNANYLAGFKDAVREGSPLVVRATAPNKGVVVSCGDHFIGALMPVRDAALDVLSWRKALTSAKAVKA